MPNIFDLRQSKQRSSLPFLTGAANSTADTIVSNVDSELSKLFEDRNVLLTQGGLITYNGTTVQFGENLKLEINSQVAGGAPTIIDLGNTTRTISASGRMIYAVINRTLGTAVVTDDATTLPAVVFANQEVFLIAKRQDASDGTKRLYFRNGSAFNEGQTARLGSSGSGSGGSGTGDDINTLRFKASFGDGFDESPTSNTSAVQSSLSNASYSAANTLYRLSYDASKTGSSTGTSFTLSATPSFTVVAGDVVVNQATGEVKKITTVTTQTSYTLESAFASNLSSAAVTVSQAVHSVDLRAYTANSTGLAINAIFSSDTVSTYMLWYRDSLSSGDTIWDMPGTPVVAFTASADNSNWTTSQTRQSDLSAAMPIRSMAASGSNFYVRFFANQTSGSGAVNILDYKVYMHEDTGASSGTTMDQAYGLTSGAGTPINCSVSSSTGKTRITTTWAYAMSVNPGTQQGQLDVYLDGKLLPRFIDSTQTPNAYYNEINANTIELDQDYSGAALEIDIKKRVNAVDTSSQNSSNITYLQSLSQSGFQGFVDQSSTLSAVNGTPGTGQFRTFGIVGRAQIPDLANDIRARMGIDRIMVEAIAQLQNEFGPNGEPVFAATNDDRGQIRFVGSWSNPINTNGQYALASSSTGDYLEIVFYGTGLNILTYFDSGARDFRSTIDGGSESGNLAPTTSSILAARNYSENVVFNIASGLTLGLHTVKIRNNNASNFLACYGFEILNESSTIRVNPGIAYQNGKKLVNSAAQSLAYNSSFDSILRDGASVGSLSTKGAHVVVYQKSDGTIAKAAIEANSTQANLGSTDHTNEEIVRRYHFHEFGAGRSDDFNPGGSSSANRAFTLDDGTTTLSGTNVRTDTSSFGVETLRVQGGTGNFFTFVFVGTGLDVIGISDNSSRTTNIAVDGVSTGSITQTAAALTQIRIVSGLPYGTHTVKFTNNSGVSDTFGITSFIVYQPKKPSIPAGAIELADYNIVSNYIATTGDNQGPISQGVLFKTNMREVTYSGSGWSIPGINPGAYSGWSATTNVSGNYAEYTFFGTGIETLGSLSGGTVNITVQIDGSNYTGSATSSNNGSWTPGTSTWSYTPGGNNGAVLQISGLTLGLHKIRLTTTNSIAWYLQGFNVLTPIHSQKSNAQTELQSTLPIGSCALSDNRKLTPVKDAIAPTKTWAQATGVQNTSTSSTSPVQQADMSITLKTSGGPVLVMYDGQFLKSDTNIFFNEIFVDGVQVHELASQVPSGQRTTVTMAKILFLAPGVHKFDVYWYVAGGSIAVDGPTGGNRNFLVREL